MNPLIATYICGLKSQTGYPMLTQISSVEKSPPFI